MARDLDVLRAAVGDAKLTFAGHSYGSFLGATYANLFPQRVRAIVLDGVLDPVGWTTGRGPLDAATPFSLRVGSQAGEQPRAALLPRDAATRPARRARSPRATRSRSSTR